MSHVPRTLALLIALAACACGGESPDTDRSTAGGQTGGESPHAGSPPGCREQPTPIDFDAVGANGFSAESAFAKFGTEYVGPGTISNIGSTTFRSRLTYADRSYTVCDVLLLDVTWSLSTDDGSFNEVFPATLTVSSLEKAELGATLLLTDLQGSYQAPQANDSEAKLTFSVSFTPAPAGAVHLKSASQSETLIANF